MDFKKIITEMLDNLKKNEITLSTDSGEKYLSNICEL